MDNYKSGFDRDSDKTIISTQQCNIAANSSGVFNSTIRFSEQKYGYDKEQVDQYIKELTAEYNVMYEQYTTIEKDNAFLKSDTDSIGRALLRAEVLAQQIIDEAKNKTMRIAEEATNEAERITNEANEKAEIIINEAQNKAGCIVYEAKAKADTFFQVVEAMKEKADTIFQAAKQIHDYPGRHYDKELIKDGQDYREIPRWRY